MAKEATKKVEKKVEKKDNFFVRTGKKIKEIFSELKKVSWPTFPKIAKATGIVIVVVLVFTIAVTVVDSGLIQLLKLLTNLG